MLQVNVSFPSGSGKTLLLPEHSKVGDLKILAQKTFQKGLLKLVTAEGNVLTNPEESLQAALQGGELLTAVAQRAFIASTCQAFAAWCCGGNRIVSWGSEDYGGDCSAVQHQLRHVQQVHATDGAFAAILADGSVVAWGLPFHGGDCSAVQDQLMQECEANSDYIHRICSDLG